MFELSSIFRPVVYLGIVFQSIFSSPGYNFFMQFYGPWSVILRTSFDLESSIWVFMLNSQERGLIFSKEDLILPEGSVVVKYIKFYNWLNQLVYQCHDSYCGMFIDINNQILIFQIIWFSLVTLNWSFFHEFRVMLLSCIIKLFVFKLYATLFT